LAPSQPRTDPDATLALWHAWRATRDPALRDRLVLGFAPMVKWIAYRKVRELPAWCDMDDFVSAGLEAILRSLDRFDPAKGATLEQFLWTRVHGAVLDELRKHDWAPRSVRRGLRAAGDAADHFTAIHGRHPSREELADATGMTVTELRALHDDAARAEVGSLNVPVRADDHQVVERIDTLEDRAPGDDPLDVAAGEQAQDTFRAAFTRLPEREQVLAVLLYVEGLTLREAGRAIGISESRASQLHARLRTRLRAELADARDLFATA
jgi:RNA polymerase sigma factor FliA